jgi:uncharacterized low-complexity protein
MFTHRTIGAALVGATLLTAPASAGMLEKDAVQSREVVGPTAKGDVKPYHALVEGVCAGGLCTVNFGKKSKLRQIRMITCGTISDQDPLLAGVVFGEALDNDVRFFLPVTSVGTQGAGKVGVFQFQFDFDVPAGTKMQVILQTDGTADFGTCTITGTIR